jgi:hypothetical protein
VLLLCLQCEFEVVPNSTIGAGIRDADVRGAHLDFKVSSHSCLPSLRIPTARDMLLQLKESYLQLASRRNSFPRKIVTLRSNS